MLLSCLAWWYDSGQKIADPLKLADCAEAAGMLQI